MVGVLSREVGCAGSDWTPDLCSRSRFWRILLSPKIILKLLERGQNQVDALKIISKLIDYLLEFGTFHKHKTAFRSMESLK